MPKTVITYGTYDLFHKGHRRLLERAKKLGDKLIVGVTTDNYDDTRGKLNVHQTLMQRIENVRESGLADEIIIEEYEGQKINDILKYKVDIFAIGSDWQGQFDYLKEYCEVVYLERTKGVSSTGLRNQANGILKIGLVGYGRIATRFIAEARYVSGVNVEGVLGRNAENVQKFASDHQLAFATTDFDDLLSRVQAVYIASPHLTHYDYARRALEAGVHVLCEKPMALEKQQVHDLFELATKKNLVFMEAVKTAYAPGFMRMVAVAKSGSIGHILNVDATFTKLIEDGDLREFKQEEAGGSTTELASYPLLAVVKLLGMTPKSVQYNSYFSTESGVDMFTNINMRYGSAVANLKVGLGAKAEGDLIVTGTKGYLYVPSPWWKTEYFETRFENPSDNKKYYYKFDGDGLRYEIAEFASLVNSKLAETHKLTPAESSFIVKVIEDFRDGKNVNKLIIDSKS